MLQRIGRIFVGINCTSSILDFLLLFVVHQGFHPTVICRGFILQTTRIIEIPPTNPQGILTFARYFTRRHRDVRCITKARGILAPNYSFSIQNNPQNYLFQYLFLSPDFSVITLAVTKMWRQLKVCRNDGLSENNLNSSLFSNFKI